MHVENVVRLVPRFEMKGHEGSERVTVGGQSYA